MKYYIGLDMGTSSVGWAVTDTRYNLVRKKGKDMWGVRLFDEANTAAERRSHRTSRRRLDREKARIAYLKEIFSPAIEEKDPGFFQRLEDSKFYEEDKKEHQPFALFADTGYTDREYYEEYPTIFHLRKELIESKEPHDVRLVYLAVLNMFKHRGHFLTPNLESGEIRDLSEPLKNLKDGFSAQFDKDFPVPENIEDLEEILGDRSKSASIKLDEILKLLDINKKDKDCKAYVETWKLICGLKGVLPVIFENDIFSEEKYSISFKDGNYDEKEEEISEILNSESFEIFETIKQIYDWGVLSSIMKGYSYISMAKVASYEKHEKDLEILKKVYKKYLPENYNDMFRVMKDNNYSAYVGSVNSKEEKTNSGKNKVRRGGKKSDEFFKEVKKQISKIDGYEEIEECTYIISEIDKGTFLPKQLTTDNGVIPNQVYRAELEKILDNAETYLTFLKEKDPEYGLTAKERILEMFSFRIPYYVGPLKGTEDSISWAVRKESGTVYPWNISEKIDVKMTSQKFIEQLIRHCSYLSDEKVLPKSSLLYEKYMVLNELNNLRIHEEKISPELKQDIYIDLFRKTGKRVTNKKLLSYLKIHGFIGSEETEDALSGYDKEKGGFTNTLANYHKFSEVFDTDVLTDHQREMAETIIFYSTVYGDSREFLKQKITELYGDELSAAQVKRILGYKFKDWGNLSKEFLYLEGADKNTGEILPLITRMWEENDNLMQILDQSRYTYREALEDKTRKIEKNLREVTFEDLEGLYISAPVRRMVWQSIRIVQEIEKVMKEEPERIFIEMTRSKDKEKKRSVSRKAALQGLYKGCAEDEKYLKADIDSRDEREFRIKKLYLYYLQKGRCMYSGERIPLEKLFDDGYYDIDHIYPRHFVKDDSLENNLVLVKAELNREKADEFPISEDIRKKCSGMWKDLKEGHFITPEKYSRLTRTQPFSEEEKIKFVNRQLVETSQGTKAVAEIFTEVFSGGKANDRVVYVKAGNVSEFRQKYKMFKCRSVNDFHHANDAYLNIVVGNTYFTKFTRDARNFFKSSCRPSSADRNNSYNLGRMFDFKVERGEILAWDPQKDIATVKKMMEKNTPIVTKRSYEVHGSISDQNIIGAAVIRKAGGVGYIPIKSSNEKLSDTLKYGGFKNARGAYFFLVEHTKKKKRVRTLESMPVYLSEKYKGKEGLEEYCRSILNLSDPDVRLEKIKMYSLLKINGFNVYLTGRTGNYLIVRNAVQLCLKPQYMEYIREIDKVLEQKYTDEQLENIKNIQRNSISTEKNIELYDQLLNKHVNEIYSRRQNPVGDKLITGREKFENLPVSRQCNVLSQILLLSQPVNQADLTEIGLSKETGKSKSSKDINGYKEFRLILQSVTGLYEQEIDLLRI